MYGFNGLDSSHSISFQTDTVFLDSRIAFNRAWRINRNWNFQWRVAVILVDRIADGNRSEHDEPSLDRLNPEPEHRENV